MKLLLLARWLIPVLVFAGCAAKNETVVTGTISFQDDTGASSPLPRAEIWAVEEEGAVRFLNEREDKINARMATILEDLTRAEENAGKTRTEFQKFLNNTLYQTNSEYRDATNSLAALYRDHPELGRSASEMPGFNGSAEERQAVIRQHAELRKELRAGMDKVNAIALRARQEASNRFDNASAALELDSARARCEQFPTVADYFADFPRSSAAHTRADSKGNFLIRYRSVQPTVLFAKASPAGATGGREVFWILDAPGGVTNAHIFLNRANDTSVDPCRFLLVRESRLAQRGTRHLFDSLRDFANFSCAGGYGWAENSYGPGVAGAPGKVAVRQYGLATDTLVLTRESYTLSKTGKLAFSVFFRNDFIGPSTLKMGLIERPRYGQPSLQDRSRNPFLSVSVGQYETNLGISAEVSNPDAAAGVVTLGGTRAAYGKTSEWYQLVACWSTNCEMFLYDCGSNGAGLVKLVGHAKTRDLGNSPLVSRSNLLFGVYGSSAWGLSIDNVSVPESFLRPRRTRHVVAVAATQSKKGVIVWVVAATAFLIVSCIVITMLLRRSRGP